MRTPSLRSSTDQLVDQMVVSVGPYMFWIFADEISRSCFTTVTGRLSPPISNLSSERSLAAGSGPMVRVRAIDGVHCRCVIPYLWISSGMDEPGDFLPV